MHNTALGAPLAVQPDEPLPRDEHDDGERAAMAQADYVPVPIIEKANPQKRLSVLKEADSVAGEDRSRDYGHPLVNHQRIADIWTVQAGALLRPGEKFTPRLVALMMIGLKLAREANTPKRDNLVDMAGYVKCIDMIDEAESWQGNF